MNRRYLLDTNAVIYLDEPALKELEFFKSKVVNDLAQAHMILANRITGDVRDVADKVYIAVTCMDRIKC